MWESYRFYHDSPSKYVVFFQAVQYLKNLIEYILSKPLKLMNVFLNYKGIFSKYLIDTLK